MGKFQDYLAQRQTRPGLADIALSLGVPVFPCWADKRPATARGFKDASQDETAVRRMFSSAGAALIGMPTGEVSGVVVVDVDIKINRQGDAWLQENSARLPQTRTIRTGSGGLHLYFKWPGQRVKNSNDKIAPGIDVRGDGGYVVVPPSVAPPAKAYAVADDAPVADLPEWLLAVLCPVEPESVTPDTGSVTFSGAQPVGIAHTPSRSVTSGGSVTSGQGGTPYGLAALADECLRVRMAGFGNQENTLNAAGLKIGALVAGGELDEGAALAELLAAARSMPSQPGKARWSAMELDRKARRAFSDGRRTPREAPDRPMVTPLEEVHPAAPFLAIVNARVAARNATPLPVTADLMDVDGVLRLFVNHCEATAFSSQPFLALGAGICALGALAGRRYRTRTDLRSNIYAIGIADSGGGKDHARGVVKKAFFAAGLDRYLGGNKLASGAGLLTALGRHPSMLFQIDEMGLWLQGILGQKAANHQKEIWANLTELYTSANMPFGGTEYANQKDNARVVIHQPNACLYGTSVPNEFWAALQSGALQNGSMARFLVFLSPLNYPDTPLPAIAAIPEALTAGLQAIAAGVPDHDAGGNLAALMAAQTDIVPYTVPETPDAAAAMLELKAVELKWKREAEGTYATALIARLFENACKLALIRAISRRPERPVIEAGDVAWGQALARHCIDTLMREAGRFVADSEYEAKLNRALHLIRRHGPCTEAILIRQGFKLPERERAEILRTLLESKQIQAISKPSGPKGGKPTIRYLAPGEVNLMEPEHYEN